MQISKKGEVIAKNVVRAEHFDVSANDRQKFYSPNVSISSPPKVI